MTSARYSLYEEMELLITVKAYPAVSSKYGESVCAACIRVDREPHEWVRLFPVGFRELPEQRQFHKYQRIHLRARRGRTDRRHETWKPDVDSITLGEVLPSGG